MMISTRGRYAIRMMMDLAENQGDCYVSLKDIAARQDISKKDLEQIIPLLNQADLTRTCRGSQGGYRLSRPAKEYTLLEILQATETSIAPVTCLEYEENTCPRSADCPTLPVWQGLNQVVREYLAGITLQDVIDDNVPDPPKPL